MTNEVILKEIINNMSDAELKSLKKRIDAILEGDLTELNIDISKINIMEELDDYLNAKKIENKSPGTIKQYGLSLSNMLTHINKPVTLIRTDDIRKYLNYKKVTNKISDTSLENQRVIINTFFKWLKDNGYIQNNPCALIHQIKYEYNPREAFTIEELDQIRKVCASIRDKAIIEVFYSTGCRVSELIGLKLNDINFETREVHLFGKGRKHRISYLNDSAIKAIKEYLPYRYSTSEFLFVTERAPHGPITTTRAIEKKIKALGEKANIAGGAFPHRFRHTTATHLLNAGMPIEQVQMFLGHENISTTQIYAKTEQEKLKNTYLQVFNK